MTHHLDWLTYAKAMNRILLFFLLFPFLSKFVQTSQ